MHRRYSLLMFASLLAHPLSAQKANPPEEEAEILVEGQSKPKRASVKQFREAQLAFEKLRPTLAPGATLRYRIVANIKSGVTPANIDAIRLSLVSETDRITIPIGADHQFVMPNLRSISDDYRLFANVGKKPIYIAPRVMSPGTILTDRRVGDLRLECQTGWAYYKSEVSVVMRAGFGMIGGCSSKRVAIYNRMDGPVSSATVIDGKRTLPIPIWPKIPDGYRSPIYDKSLSNDARVKVVLK